jgi:hypothetical protein
VVVRDFDIVRAILLPGETDPKLIVDADAELPCPVAAQRFQTIARRDAQTEQIAGCFQLIQFAARHGGNRCKWTAAPGFEKFLRFRISETLDRVESLYNVSRIM